MAETANEMRLMAVYTVTSAIPYVGGATDARAINIPFPGSLTATRLWALWGPKSFLYSEIRRISPAGRGIGLGTKEFRLDSRASIAGLPE